MVKKKHGDPARFNPFKLVDKELLFVVFVVVAAVGGLVGNLPGAIIAVAGASAVLLVLYIGFGIWARSGHKS